MTRPLPPWVGYPLLWHLVQPGRMVLAGGLLLLIFAFVLGAGAAARVSRVSRCLSFRTDAAAGMGALQASVTASAGARRTATGSSSSRWPSRRRCQAVRLLTPARANTLLIASAAALGVVSFGTFNPIQIDDPDLREAHHTPVTAEFDRRLPAGRTRVFLLVPWGTSFFAHSGLPLIGLGLSVDRLLDVRSGDGPVEKIYPEVAAGPAPCTFNNVGQLCVRRHSRAALAADQHRRADGPLQDARAPRSAISSDRRTRRHGAAGRVPRTAGAGASRPRCTVNARERFLQHTPARHGRVGVVAAQRAGASARARSSTSTRPRRRWSTLA